MTDLFNRFSKKSIIPYEPPPRISTASDDYRQSTSTKHHSTPSRKAQTGPNSFSQPKSCRLRPPLAIANNPKIPGSTQLQLSENEVNELFEQGPVQRKTDDTQPSIAIKPLPPQPSAVASRVLQQSSSTTTRSNGNSNFFLRPSVSLIDSLRRGNSIFSQESKDHNSPEFFIQKFMGTNLRTVSVSDASNLESCLRSRPITWLVKFIDLKGLHILILCLHKINHQLNRSSKKALDIEFEIIKCIKALINTGIGGIETTSHPSYIHTIVFSLVCPYWQTRKLVCDILIFICYHDAGNSEQDSILGHQHIIRGFELLKQLTNDDKGLFSTWMIQLAAALDGRGRLGSLVGAHSDLKKLGILKFPDKQLMEYATSNMLLINALTKVPRTASQRIVIRNQFNTSGMEKRALSKLRGLKYAPLKRQITAYEDAAANDLNTIFHDYFTPYPGNGNTEKTLDLLVKGLDVSSNSTTDNLLLGTMKSLLMTQGSMETREYYCHIIHALAANYRRSLKDQDVTAIIGLPPNDLIQHFSDSDRIHQLHNKTAGTKTINTPDPDDITMLGLKMDSLKQHENDQSRQLSRRRSLDLKTETVYLDSHLASSQTTINIAEKITSEAIDRGGFISNADCAHDELGSKEPPSKSPSYSSLIPPPPPPTPPLSIVTEMNSSQAAVLNSPSPPPPPTGLPLTTSSSQPYSNNTTPRKQMQHQPLKKLKNLQWQKLDSKNMDKTVWSLADGNEADLETKLSQAGVFHSIDTMFTAKTNTTFDRKLKALTDEKMGVVKFLSGAKSRGLSIAVLPKLKQFDDFTFARQTIMRMDPDFCTENMLNNLILYTPSREDDLVTMEKYTKATVEECHSLDLSEQFTIEMLKMYRYPQRLQFMLFRVQFWEKLNRLYENLITVANVSDSLCKSKSLKELLNIILLMGNYMNGSSLQGGALGIRIVSLNKLIDTKASNTTSLTLLHVLAGTIRREFPYILEFVDDLKDTGNAARIMASLNDIVHEYSDMRQKLKQLDDELKTHWMVENVEQGDRFHQVMSEYYEEAIGQFEDLETLYRDTDDKWKKTMVFYGENPQTMRPDEFFSVFATFLNHWKVASIEEKQYSERMERRLWQTRRQASVSKNNSTATTAGKRMRTNSNSDSDHTQGDDNSQGNDECNSTGFEPTSDDCDDSNSPDEHQDDDWRRMDDLLDRLRSGKSLHGSRRLRHKHQQNTIQAALAPLQTSTSSPIPGSSSWPSSPSSIDLNGSSIGDGGGSLSAEDLLRDLQNGD